MSGSLRSILEDQRYDRIIREMTRIAYFSGKLKLDDTICMHATFPDGYLCFAAALLR